MQKSTDAWSLVCHLDLGGSGAVVVLRNENGRTTATRIAAGQSTGGPHAPVYLGLDREGSRALIMDPVSKAISFQANYPENAFAPYAYSEGESGNLWYVNDGDKETGNEPLNCGDNGSSVTVVSQCEGLPALKKLVCVGRGHHMTAFTYPTEKFPNIPRRAFVSNLIDGTISVLGNDPDNADQYLKVITVINLCEPDREDGQQDRVPNNAFPHGKVFSTVTGKIYCLNNGYGTIAIVDPVSNVIEARIPMEVSSNLLLSPDGRFVVGKGADRKADPDHVLGRLSVLDVVAGEVVTTMDLKDVYPSTYRFSPDGKRLYVTTAASGKGEQRDNLRKDVVLVYDSSRLPALELMVEIPVGRADCGRRPLAMRAADGDIDRLFFPNPTDGSLTVVDAKTHGVLETVTLNDGPVREVNFSFLNTEGMSGC